MNFPEELKYTKDHEWVKLQDDLIVIGVTDFAQSELGDIVYVDVDTLDETVEENEVFGSIEAVKTVSDLFMPVSGEVVEFNEAIEDEPELVNTDPYGKGWMIKVKPNNIEDIEKLLDAQEYKQNIGAK